MLWRRLFLMLFVMLAIVLSAFGQSDSGLAITPHDGDGASSGYHVGKLVLTTALHVHDWYGHYTSENGSVNVYCDFSSFGTNCGDLVGGNSGWYEVELEGESTARKHILHTLTPVAVFVEGKQIKPPYVLGEIDEDYGPLERAKQQLARKETDKPVNSVTEMLFEYRLSTARARNGKNIAVYCVPFTLRKIKRKKEVEKSAETCYELYLFDLMGKPQWSFPIPQ